MIPEEELAKIREEDKKNNDDSRTVGFIIIGAALGFGIGAFFGMFVGYQIGQNSMWEMMKSLLLYKGIAI